MPRKRARPVREGVVGKGAPPRSHLAGDLLHRTAGSGSGSGKRAGRKTGTAPRTDFTTRGGRIARCSCIHLARNRLFPNRFSAGSGADLSSEA